MGKFRNKIVKKTGIPTASLPDIIFMLLFFFMVTTVLRQSEVLVEQRLPAAEQLQKLQRKSLVTHIYIGAPVETERWGSGIRIQANDALIAPAEIGQFIREEQKGIIEAERDQLTVALDIDEEAAMGLVTDVQQELRRANARKIMYVTKKEIEI
ncbi:MAG: ExbD/TolR family protein [Cyclobacteriaceae bacterium]